MTLQFAGQVFDSFLGVWLDNFRVSERGPRELCTAACAGEGVARGGRGGVSCGPDPCARSPALGGELSLHEPLWLSLRCPRGSRSGVPGGGPGCLSALPPLLLALPRDPQPRAEADHGDQHRLPAPARCKRRGPQHKCSSSSAAVPPDASHLPGRPSPTQPQCTPRQDGGVCSHKKGNAHLREERLHRGA